MEDRKSWEDGSLMLIMASKLPIQRWSCRRLYFSLGSSPWCTRALLSGAYTFRSDCIKPAVGTKSWLELIDMYSASRGLVGACGNLFVEIIYPVKKLKNFFKYRPFRNQWVMAVALILLLLWTIYLIIS